MADTSICEGKVNFRVLFNGTFYKSPVNHRLKYIKGDVYCYADVDPNLVSKVVLKAMFIEDIPLPDVREIWYLIPGKAINEGLILVANDRDSMEAMKFVNRDNCVHLYAVQTGEKSQSDVLNEVIVNEGEAKISSNGIPDLVEVQNQCEAKVQPVN